jgi:hypothetical protein
MASHTLEGQLDIVAWPGYIERGETDKAYDWVTAFDGADRLQVNVKSRHLGRNGHAHDQRRSAAEPARRCSWPPAGKRALRPR